MAAGPGAPAQTERRGSDTMRCLLRSLLCCAALLLSGVRATYHLGAGQQQLIAAQSYAQTRNNGRPPMRTLNPASKFHLGRGFIGLGVTLESVHGGQIVGLKELNCHKAD